MQKIKDLVKLYHTHGIDAYVIPSNDEFQNEYPPSHLDRLFWLTGFSSSNATLIMTKSRGLLFTDGRYLLQANKELGEHFTILDMYATPSCEHIGKILKPGMTLGYDPMLHSIHNFSYYEKLAKRFDFQLKAIDENLVDIIRSDSIETAALPSENHSKVIELDIQYAGVHTDEKLKQILNLVEKCVDYLLVTRLDSICWLMNIRGNAVPYTPLLLCYLLIEVNSGKLSIFLEDDKISIPNADIRPLEQIKDEFKKLIVSLKKIQIDQSHAAVWFLQNGTVDNVKLTSDPIEKIKAVKNPCEIEGFKTAHLQDGIAVVEFLAWLETAQRISEIEASEKLLEFRKKGSLFQYPSFETISASGPNGAIIHYRPTSATNIEIADDNLYLVDSGGQYLCGTTDVTRTVCLKSPSHEHKLNFTLVLKGLIRLTRVKFPIGTRGGQLDCLARLDLWSHGKDYKHGTGHGVGHFLSVHEGPQRISPGKATDVPLEPGMVLSIEPGCYIPEKYGIRIENLALVKQSDQQGVLEFQTLTLVPIQHNIVDFSMIDASEKAWLIEYHQLVYDTLERSTSPRAKEYLLRQLKAYIDSDV